MLSPANAVIVSRAAASITIQWRAQAVALQEKVDERTGSLQLTVGRWDVNLQALDLTRFLGALIHLYPDALVVGDDLALASVSPAARAVAKLLGAGLRADVLHVAEDTVAAGLAAKERLLEGELRALEGGGQARPPFDPREDARERTTEPRVTSDRERPPEQVEDPWHELSPRPVFRRRRTRRRCSMRSVRVCPRRAIVQIEASRRAVLQLGCQLLPLRDQLLRASDDPG